MKQEMKRLRLNISTVDKQEASPETRFSKFPEMILGYTQQNDQSYEI